MGKREKKIELVRKYIQSVARNWPAYAYGEIPENLVDNACSSYAGIVQYDDVIGLIDITILGTANKGMLFTTSRVYYDNGIFESRGSITYNEIYEDRGVSSDVLGASYNETALVELLLGLARIEGNTIENKIGGLLSSIDDINGEVTDLNDMIDQGAKLLGSIFGLLGLTNASENNEVIDSTGTYTEAEQIEQQGTSDTENKVQMILETAEIYKESLDDIIELLEQGMVVSDTSDGGTSREYFWSLCLCAAFYGNDIKWYRKLDDDMTEEDEQYFSSVYEVAGDIDDFIRNDVSGIVSIEGDTLQKSMKQFHIKVRRQYDLVKASILENTDMTNIFDEAQNAAKIMRSKLYVYLNALNRIIELSYDQDN